MLIRLSSAGRALAAVLVLGMLALPLRAAPGADDAHLSRVTYPVADLVIPVPSQVQVYGSALKSSPTTQEEQLIRLITTNIAPESWSEKGGRGTIDYNPLSMSLVVCQPAEVQEQIVDLLNAQRRLQETEVSLEVRFITTGEDMVKRLDLDGADGTEIQQAAASDSPLHVTFLDDDKVREMMTTLQGDGRTNVMQTPKLTMSNEQSSTLDVTNPESFVTGVDIRVGPNGGVIFTPDIEHIPVGLNMTVKPTISADRRFVKMSLKVDLSSLDDPKADLIPIKMPTMSPANPETPTFDQLIQAPRIIHLTLDQNLNIPNGRTALIRGWKRDQGVRKEIGAPILSDIPYLDRLFTTVGYSREKECVLMMVTPRIVVPADQN